jgi:hypothetical protein
MRDRRLAGAYRLFVNGWDYVHFEGSPEEIGYQHGYLLADRIADGIDRIRFWANEALKRDWKFFRKTAEDLYVSKIPEEQMTEIDGMVTGLKSRGFQLDNLDLVALNGWLDSLTMHYWLKSTRKQPQPIPQPGGCSAFIATGKHTENGEVVMAHNSWWVYLIGAAWNTISHIAPEKGNEILMQTMPGFLTSQTDWYINSAGLIVSETTITGATEFNPEGTPYFTRARRAIQYSAEIDQWTATMIEDNNGGYANDWMLGNINTGEIALLELGTFHHMVEKKQDGYFVGCNLACDPHVRRETIFNYEDQTTSPAARRDRWTQLMEEHKGRINVTNARELLADHYDLSLKQPIPSRSTICGHVEEDKRGFPEADWGPYYPAGAFDGKVTSSSLAAQGATWALWGKPCGTDFKAKEFLKRNPAYDWQAKMLSDVKAYPWTLFDPHFRRT